MKKKNVVNLFSCQSFTQKTIMILTLIITLSSCVTKKINKNAVDIQVDSITYLAKSIQIQKDSTFFIKLPSYITSGYRWYIKDSLDKTVIKFVKREVVAEKGLADATVSYEKFSFQAIQSKTSEIHFVSKHPWDSIVPLDTINYKVFKINIK